MNIKTGYKQTEIGVIPEDWEVKTIQTLIDDRTIIGHLDGNHGELYPRSHEFKEVGVPYIGANDFVNGQISFSKCKFLSKERAELFKKGISKDGDVLFAHNATVGPVAFLKTNLDYVILSTTATYFRCDTNKLNNQFLVYGLQTPSFVSQYTAVMAQSTRCQVPITTQRKFKLTLPSLPEQTAIAAALSDVDALMGELDKLIAKKRDIKQATMQQLLTGKKRLAGFSGEWEIDFVENLAQITTGSKNTQDRIDDGQYPFFVRSQTVERINSYSFDGEAVLTAGDGVGTGKVFHYINGKFDTHQRVYLISDFNSRINGYFFYLYFSSHFYNRIMQMTAKSSVDSVRKEMIAKMPIPHPPTIEEQTAIATILSDMDAEINALQQKRDKTAQLKQGMMQELLTGRIRLPIEG